MTLREARCAFSVCVAEAILYVVSQGYEVALDEGTERLTDKDPTSDHKKGSLHHLGLAQDLLLYRNGAYLRLSEEYAFLGVFWKELGIKKGLNLTWGGDFKNEKGEPKPDGNHISLSWNGLK